MISSLALGVLDNPVFRQKYNLTKIPSDLTLPLSTTSPSLFCEMNPQTLINVIISYVNEMGTMKENTLVLIDSVLKVDKHQILLNFNNIQINNVTWKSAQTLNHCVLFIFRIPH